MPATFGVTNLEGITPPSGSHVQELSDDQSTEIATVRNALGKTVIAQPKHMTERTVVLKVKGGGDIYAPTEAEFTSNTLKLIAVKVTENQDDFPDSELTYKSFV